jgi:hypothetical protein
MPDRTESNSQHIQTQTQPDNYFQKSHEAFTQTITSIVPRRQFTVGEIWDQSRNPASSFHSSSTISQPSDVLPFGLVDLLHQPQEPYILPNHHVFSVDIPTPDVTPPITRLSTPPLQLPSLTNKSLAPDFTYSYEEPTFARRLTRAGLEAGFQVLSAASIRPSLLDRVFRLSLAYHSIDQLRARFKVMLSRNINEELDFEETPFIHLGGAGTHYPRKDVNGNVITKRNNWTVRQVGPLEKRLVRAENVIDGTVEYIRDLDLSGLEGEWFDAHDVQGYLEEKWGCRLNPRSSFAECLVEDEEDCGYDFGTRRASDGSSGAPSLTHSSTNTSTESLGQSGKLYPNPQPGWSQLTLSTIGSCTPPTTIFPVPDASFGLDMSFTMPSSNSNLVDLSFDQTLGLDLAPGYDYGFPMDSGFGENMSLGLDLMGEVELVPRKKKKVAWMEVNKLIGGK